MTWQPIDSSSPENWVLINNNQPPVGFILLQTGLENFLVQERGSSPTRIQLE
jgi:hypothetical protein